MHDPTHILDAMEPTPLQVARERMDEAAFNLSQAKQRGGSPEFVEGLRTEYRAALNTYLVELGRMTREMLKPLPYRR